jgi:hypothetical protein
MAPSPTAEATRLIDPLRTSPTAKTPGRFVSSGSGVIGRADREELGNPDLTADSPVRM